MNIDRINELLNSNNDELEIIGNMVSSSDEEVRNISQSTNVDEIVEELRKLNPGVYIKADDAGMAERGITISVPVEELNLPEGFEYNDTNGITNQHHTDSGMFAALSVRHVDENLQNRINQYNSVSKDELVSRKKYLEDQKSKLATLKQTIEESNTKLEELNNKLNNEKDPSKRGPIREEIKKERKDTKDSIRKQMQELRKPMQGKALDIVSAYIGQIDKRIHNRLYENNERRWKKHEKTVKARYEKGGLLKYFGPRAIGVAAVAAALAFAPAGVPLFAAAMGPTVAGIVAAGNGIFALNTLIKTGNTLFNKIRYGGPNLQRKRDIVNAGGYLQNIDTAFRNLDRNRTNRTNAINLQNSNNLSRTLPMSNAEREKAQFLNDLNQDFDFNDLSEDNIRKLAKIYTEGMPFKDGLTGNLKDKYDSIKKFLERQNFREKLSACKLDDLSEENLRSLKEIYNEGLTYKDSFSEDEKRQFEALHKVLVDNNVIENSAAIDEPRLEEELDLDGKSVEELKKLYNQTGIEYYRSIGKENEKQIKEKLDTIRVALFVAQFNNASDLKELKNIFAEFEKVNSEKRRKVLSTLIQKLDINNKENAQKVLFIIDNDNQLLNLLSKEDLSKLNEITTSIMNRTVINKEYVNKVFIEIEEVLDQFDNVVAYSGNCSFFDGDEKKFERMVRLNSIDDKDIEKVIREEVPTFNGTIAVSKRIAQVKSEDKKNDKPSSDKTIDKIEVELSNITDRFERRFAKCSFYSGSDLVKDEQINLKSDDEKYIIDFIKKKYNFYGDIEIIDNNKRKSR